MNNRVHYTACPVCSSTQINPLITIKDHSVSGEEFVVWQCNNCQLRFTQDVPDAETIGPYYKSDDYISHTNTSEGFINKTYQRVRRITLQQKAATIAHYTGLNTGNLLDIGAGTGAFLNHMKGRGWNVTGIEPDGDARAVASNTFGLQLKEGAELQTLPKGQYDAITLWHVLEHVHDLHGYMDLLKSLLKPNGRLFIAVPNYQSGDASIYRTKWAAYDVPRHLYHFSPHAIEVLIKRHGLTLLFKKPMWFDAFYISLLSTKYQRGKPRLVGSFISGLRSNVSALLNKDRCSSLTYIIGRNA